LDETFVRDLHEAVGDRVGRLLHHRSGRRGPIPRGLHRA
jgi:hypothetical protein